MENSNIEWTDHTFNPWMGCTKVSQGCANCYAETLMDKRYGKVKWGPQGQRIRTSAANWKKPLKWDREAAAAGKRARVFCASLADVFEDKPDQPEMDEWRFDLFYLILNTPNLDWLLLTKRPENVIDTVARVMDANSMVAFFNSIWIGTSAENQEQADKRIPVLVTIPAAVRFLSMEPLLGGVDLTELHYDGVVAIDALNGMVGYPLPHKTFEQAETNAWPVDWVIVGGESGPNARPMHPDWARSIRDQCQAAGVPFFFKQWGEWIYWMPHEGNIEKKQLRHVMQNGSVYYPGNFSSPLLSMIRMGKHAAGRLLDGREWNEFPNQVTT